MTDRPENDIGYIAILERAGVILVVAVAMWVVFILVNVML